MRRCFSTFSGFRFGLLVLACVAFLPAAAYGQASMTGLIQDTSGGVLPGVTVEVASPALIEQVRVAVSDGAGRYSITNLRPGDYSVTFTLPGFATVLRDGISLTGTAVTTVNADMQVGTLEETITVTGEAPVVDVQSTTRQRVLNREVLEVLPSSRAPAKIAGLTANVVVRPDTMDVGGVQGDGSSRGGISSRGVDDSRILMQGIVTQTGVGTSHGTYNMEAFQEVLIDTGAADMETYAGGVRINFIPRDGGNQFSGSGLFAFANNSMAGNNVTPELEAVGLGDPNTVKQLVDINPSFGGPIVQDRAWFHVSGRFNRAFNFTPVRFNKNAGDPNSFTYEPDLSRDPAATENTIKNFNTRVTWQVTPKHRLAVYNDNSHICDCPRRIRANEAPEVVIGVYNLNPRWFIGADYTAPLSNRVLVEANFIRIWSSAERARTNPFFDSPVPLAQIEEQNTRGNFGIRRFRGTPDVAHNQQSPENYRVKLSYITGSNAFTVGGNLGTIGANRARFSPDAPMRLRVRNGVPNRVQVWATPYRGIFEGVELGLYAQNRWTVNRVTVNAGLRYDHLTVSFPEQFIGPGNFTPNRNITFAAQEGVKWHDLEPRLGVAFDLFGTGRTALKTSFNKYLAGEGSGGTFGIGMAQANHMVNSVRRSWRDANGNFVPDCDLTIPERNGECGSWSNPDFGTAAGALEFSDDILNGYGKRFYNWQFAAGIQQELMAGVSVEAELWRTWYGNFVIVDHQGTGPEDFEEYSLTAPVDPRLPGGGGYALPGLFDIQPDVFGTAPGGLVTRASDFGKQTEIWNGLDVTFNARPGGGVLVQGGTSTFRRATNNCEVARHVAATPPARGGTLPDYNPTQIFCDAPGTWLTQFKVLGAVTVPGDVQLSASLLNLPGAEVGAVATFSTREVERSSLGRRLAGRERNVDVPLIPARSMYGDRIHQLDIRVGKILTFGGVRTTASVDVYNLFNSGAATEYNDEFDQWQQPLSILNARFAKFVLQFSF